MNEKDFEEIWQPVKSVIDYLKMDYDESVTIGGQFGKLKSIILEQQKRLSQAEDLLSETRSIMNDVHLYNSNIYKEIGTFLHGEDEE